MAVDPRRGEVWWIAFDPSLGGEIRKTRPAVIVSNDAANKVLNRVQVVPITSSTHKIYPAEAFIMVNSEKRKAMADQLTTASKERLKEKITELTPGDIAAVEQAIRIQLAL
jgi:mRNA interferase MazF